MLCAVAGLSGIAFLLPQSAGAFWPFASASANAPATPILHDASLDLLAAPLSTNVDDVIADRLPF